MSSDPPFDLSVIPPEMIRRAIDLSTGRSHPECSTREHRRLTFWLAQSYTPSHLRDALVARQVRTEPPSWARTCSCEETADPTPQTETTDGD